MKKPKFWIKKEHNSLIVMQGRGIAFHLFLRDNAKMYTCSIFSNSFLHKQGYVKINYSDLIPLVKDVGLYAPLSALLDSSNLYLGK
jgi:hypothetical protein